MMTKEEKQKQLYKKYLDKYGGVRMYPDGRLEPIIKEKDEDRRIATDTRGIIGVPKLY